MQLLIEQLYKKINEIPKLAEQKDGLEEVYSVGMQELGEKAADLSTHLVDEKLKGEYLKKLVETKSKPATKILVNAFNREFAKYKNIQIDPELVDKGKTPNEYQSKLIDAIVSAINAHNDKCNEYHITSDKQKIKLQENKKQIDLISGKIQELKDAQGSESFKKKIYDASNRFLDSLGVLQWNIQSMPESISEDLKRFIKQMYEEHFQDKRIFEHIKNGRLEAEICKIEKIRIMYDFSIEFNNLSAANSEFNEIAKECSQNTNHLDELLQEVKKKFLDVKLENIDESLTMEIMQNTETLKNINSVISSDILMQIKLLDDKKVVTKVVNSFLHTMDYLKKGDFEANLKTTKEYVGSAIELFVEQTQSKLGLTREAINKLPNNLKVVLKSHLETNNSSNLVLARKINQLDQFCATFTDFANICQKNEVVKVSSDNILQNFAQKMAMLKKNKNPAEIEALLDKHIDLFQHVDLLFGQVAKIKTPMLNISKLGLNRALSLLDNALNKDTLKLTNGLWTEIEDKFKACVVIGNSPFVVDLYKKMDSLEAKVKENKNSITDLINIAHKKNLVQKMLLDAPADKINDILVQAQAYFNSIEKTVDASIMINDTTEELVRQKEIKYFPVIEDITKSIQEEIRNNGDSFKTLQNFTMVKSITDNQFFIVQLYKKIAEFENKIKRKPNAITDLMAIAEKKALIQNLLFANSRSVVNVENIIRQAESFLRDMDAVADISINLSALLSEKLVNEKNSSDFFIVEAISNDLQKALSGKKDITILQDQEVNSDVVKDILQRFEVQRNQYKQQKDLETNADKNYVSLTALDFDLNELKNQIQISLGSKLISKKLLDSYSDKIERCEEIISRYPNYFLTQQKYLADRLSSLAQVKTAIGKPISLNGVLATIAGLGLFIDNNSQNCLDFKRAVINNKKDVCVEIINREIVIQNEHVKMVINGAEHIVRKIDEIKQLHDKAALNIEKNEYTVLLKRHTAVSNLLHTIADYKKTGSYIFKNILTFGVYGSKIRKEEKNLTMELDSAKKLLDNTEKQKKNVIILAQRKENIKSFLSDIVQSFSSVDVKNNLVENNSFIYSLAELGNYLKLTYSDKGVDEIQQEIGKMISEDADFKKQIASILKNPKCLDMVGGLFMARQKLTDEIAEQENIDIYAKNNLKILGDNLFIFSKFFDENDIKLLDGKSAKFKRLERLIIPAIQDYCQTPLTTPRGIVERKV